MANNILVAPMSDSSRCAVRVFSCNPVTPCNCPLSSSGLLSVLSPVTEMKNITNNILIINVCLSVSFYPEVINTVNSKSDFH